MTDVQPGLEPASTSSSNELMQGNRDMVVEQMISDKLIKGYVLCKSGCPMCSTPLVKNQSELTIAPSGSMTNPLSDPNSRFPILVPSESFEQPFIPVIGVPYCVSCQAHVVTCEQDVDALERSESFKDRGSILVALEEEEERRDTLDDSILNVSNDRSRSGGHYNPHDENSDDGTSSFTKSLSSIMKESESILGRPVDPNRFTTALFCGTTASRQMVSTSPVNIVTVDNDLHQQHQVSDPYNQVDSGVKYEDKAFADALEEDPEDNEEPQHGRYSPLDAGEISNEGQDEDEAPNEDEEAVKRDGEEDPEEMMIEYNVRRQLASKLLATKLLEGYLLRDSQCAICSMPMMEYRAELTCVVCPVLMQSSTKKNNEQKGPLSPVERKANSIQRRWANEASHVAEAERLQLEAEAETRRQLEERQRMLENEEAERRRIQAEQEAALAAEEEERRQLEETLDAEERELLELQERQRALDMEGEERMREMGILLREQQRQAAMAAYREDMLRLAQSTQLPLSPMRSSCLGQLSPRHTSSREDPPSRVTSGEYPSAPPSPRVQAIIHEIEDEHFLEEAKTFVAAMRLEDFDDASNLPVEALSPGAALILRQALYLEEVGAEMHAGEAQFQEARSHAEAVIYQEGLSAGGNTHYADDYGGASPSGKAAWNTRGSATDPNTPFEDSQVRDAMIQVDAMLFDEVKAAENARSREEAMLAEEARIKYEAYIAEEARLAEDERLAEEKWLLEETRRLELLEEKKIMEEALNNEVKFSDGEHLRHAATVEDQRQMKLEKSLMEARRIDLIEAAEGARLMEMHDIAQKKAEEKESMILALEQEADEKLQDAELAKMRAEIAMEQAAALRRESLADLIAQAEVEVLEETRAILESECAVTEDIMKIEEERWNSLRAEGRAILTRRMMHGWKLNDSFCRGDHCRHSPIVQKAGTVECVVCGGSGNGKDGVYAIEQSPDEANANQDFDASRDEKVSENMNGKNVSTTREDDVQIANFDDKRHLVSQEIGRKMIEGWTLLDLSCPHCVMPLMADGLDGKETCVMCGPVNLDDGEKTDEVVPSAPSISLHSQNVAQAIRRQVSKDMDYTRCDPPESIGGYNREESSARNDPPAFFGNDYVSPRGQSKQTLDNTLPFFKTPVPLPDGVDMDDDLMSVVVAAQDDMMKEDKNTNDQRGADQFPSFIGTDESSLSTARSNRSKNLSSAQLMNRIHEIDTPKNRGGALQGSMSTSGVAPGVSPPVASSHRLPPRPGPNRPKPPASHENARVMDVIAPQSLVEAPKDTRRGPPRPEAGGSRRPPAANASSPKGSPKALSPRQKSLSASLAELRDRDDDSRALSRAESRAETVASEALEAILDRMTECRSVLTKSSDISKQKEMANLIEQLASAAVAVKKMEEMGVY